MYIHPLFIGETVLIKLIAALGNPGIQYRDTRHNIGWMLLEFLPFYQELNWKNRFHGEIATFSLEGETRHVVRPLTYMNRSGRCVSRALDYFKVTPADMLVIHDELELAFGVIGFKEGGGLGGHNGLRSVTAAIGTRDFMRLRLGISRPDHDDITGYVLSPFAPPERDQLPDLLTDSADLLVNTLARDNFPEAAEKYGKYPLLHD